MNGNGGCRELESEGAETVVSGTDVLKHWGYECEKAAHPKGENGSAATLLEKELEGELVTYAGEHYLR
jgi:hypothetical protein